MPAITLQSATGNQAVDRILTAIVGIFELAFPNLIRAYYLTGSYHDRSAIAASDIDLIVIAKDNLSEANRQQLRQMDDWCELLTSVPLDIGFFDEQEIHHQCPTNLKLSSLFIYGQDIRDNVALPEHAAYLRECMHRAFHRLLWIRQHPASLSYPLTYPDPSGEFYGYDIQKTDELGHLEQPTTERLIGNLLWMATAQLASNTSLYFSSKQEVIRAHQTIFADAWSNLIENAYQQCRSQWGYRLPEEQTQRAELRKMCTQVLDFENVFLRQYHSFLLNELNSHDAEAKQEAGKRLNRIHFEI
jgi:hypothetical protein